MTNSNDAGDAQDWTPFLGPIDGTEYKWGINGASGELTIWQVGGPGDGHPDHLSVLSQRWGRDDLHQPGDLLGSCLRRPGRRQDLPLQHTPKRARRAARTAARLGQRALPHNTSSSSTR